MPGSHLTPFDRMEIQSCLRLGLSNAEIARRLGRHASTIGREIRRSADSRGRYQALVGQLRYTFLRAAGGRPACADNKRLVKYVSVALKRKWSPEQIAGRLPIEFPRDTSMRISHETVYRLVYADKRNGGNLYRHLRQRPAKRRNRLHSKGKRGLIKERVSIESRPAIVDEQRRIGDWEGDTVFGKGHAHPLATFVERKMLYTRIAPMKDKSAASLYAASLNAFESVPSEMRHTLTVDNGTEFAHFKAIEKTLGLAVFFGRPYTATDRAINENTNGLLRQYLPKKTNFKKITHKQLIAIVESLNNRPRKKLGYRTPNEVFQKACIALRS